MAAEAALDKAKREHPELPSMFLKKYIKKHEYFDHRLYSTIEASLALLDLKGIEHIPPNYTSTYIIQTNVAPLTVPYELSDIIIKHKGQKYCVRFNREKFGFVDPALVMDIWKTRMSKEKAIIWEIDDFQAFYDMIEKLK